MNPLTHFKKIRILPLLIALVLVSARAYAIDVSPDPVIRWSNRGAKSNRPVQRRPGELWAQGSG